MNKRTPLLLPFILLAFTSLACSISAVRGSGKVISSAFEVQDFERISVANGMTLYLTQGDQESLTIEADDNILPLIEVTVDERELTVRLDSTSGRAYSLTNPIKVYATMVDIRGISLSGGSKGEVDGITTDQLELNISGGGRMVLENLDTPELIANFSGGSGAEIVGSVNMLELNMSGGGNTQAENLQVETARVELSGGAGATVWVNNSLEADLSGGSQLRYYGTPRVSSNTSGGARVTSIGEK